MLRFRHFGTVEENITKVQIGRYRIKSMVLEARLDDVSLFVGSEHQKHLFVGSDTRKTDRYRISNLRGAGRKSIWATPTGP
jgi:hypothetical protein